MATTLKLNHPVTVNGVTYNDGDKVSDKKVADDIQRIASDYEASQSSANIHHGAVPTSQNPLEATAQTPTRPLAQQEVVVDPAANEVPTVNHSDVAKGDPATEKVVVGEDGKVVGTEPNSSTAAPDNGITAAPDDNPDGKKVS